MAFERYVERSRCSSVVGRPAGPAEVSIEFDTRPTGITIAFYADHCPTMGDERWLWWTRPASPKVIDRVSRLISREGLNVDSIAIGALDGYPVALHRWPRWLAHWSQGPGPRRFVVDTHSLDDSVRQRFVDATTREIALLNNADPVAKMMTGIRRWFHRSRQ